MSEGKVKGDVVREGGAAAFQPRLDPINGVDLTGMMQALRRTPAERLRYATHAARNIGRLVRASRRGRQ